MLDPNDVETRLANALGPLRDFVEWYVRGKGYPREVAWASADRFTHSVQGAFSLLRLCSDMLPHEDAGEG
jgi:hypothetical protein